MKIFMMMLFVLLEINATEYYSKVQPKEHLIIKSSVSGEVVFVDDKKEASQSDGTVVIRIDDKIDKADLKASKMKLEYLITNIKLLKQSVANAKRVADINLENYNRVKDLSSYSKLQKDAKLLSMINARNSFITAKTSLENLKTQKEDLLLRIETLKDRIEKKSIEVKKNHYIYKIYPRVGDYVNPGSKLMDIYDISAAKLVIYLSADELEGIREKKIYIDSKESDLKIDKIWRVADSVNISSYRVEILTKKQMQFSKLIKIEFK